MRLEADDVIAFTGDTVSGFVTSPASASLMRR